MNFFDLPSRIHAAFITAWRTLTVLRLPGREAQCFADALPFFPLVGWVLGGIAALGAWLGMAAGGPSLAGFVGAGLLTLCTGALHLDGLADSVDGLYGGSTPERRLEIMKDPRIGAMGAVALVFAVLLKIFALSRLASIGAWPLMALPFVWSRAAMVGLAVSMPYARRDGTAKGFVDDARAGHAIAATLLAAALTVGLAPLAAAACALFSAAWAAVLRRKFLQAIGGLTGDLLGFACEFIEIALLLGLALAKGAL
jgi:adenosylcobinamide-GDP ribazoletransferase